MPDRQDAPPAGVRRLLRAGSHDLRMSIDEIFEQSRRRIQGAVPATPEEVGELERLVGRPLPRQYRAWLLRAGRDAGNLTFVQTHKIVRPSIEAAIAAHRPRRAGRRRRLPSGLLFFADGGTCQDCGPAFLVLEPLPGLPGLAIDPDDPPVTGFDYEEPVLLSPRLSEYVQRAVPARRST